MKMAGLREYFQQTFEERLMSSLPDEVLNQPTPATQLLLRKQEMDQVETALSSQKEVRARQTNDQRTRKNNTLPSSLPLALLFLFLSLHRSFAGGWKS